MNNKKIGILTINDDFNLGNRLQNYAVQQYLEMKGFYVETINNYLGYSGIKKYKLYIKSLIKYVLGFILPKYARYVNFCKFNKKHIKKSSFFIDKNNIDSKLNRKYDVFFTGSDQVWNPTFDRVSDIDFLTFADKEKRNSFSASFGISDIPEDMKEYYKQRLNGLNNISVREERGKEIINELTGREDVEVLIDPTMLLDVKQWDKVAKSPKKLKNEKYILNYFLGELSQERRKEIERVAKEKKCQIINISNKKNPFYTSGPSEFLYLEKNASLICTDSFHSSVFAILYKRPFIVFDREDKETKMNSRMETLLSKFNLQHRKFDGKINESLLKNNDMDIDEILKKERGKAEKFIQKVLD